MRSTPIASIGIVLATLLLAAQGCGSDAPLGDGNPEAGVGNDGEIPLFGQDGGGSGPCVGLQCKQVACSRGGSTTVSGTVFAPRKSNPDPLYNAIVYVPNAPVLPFPAGVACDKCGALTSGSPVVTALSGPDGKFVLKDVPAGDDIPLVVQLGKWRRQVVIPKVAPCTDTAVGPELTRLPRNKSEGDIPLHAISTGDADALECVLRKMGVDDAEFTVPSRDGRIHLFNENGATLPNIPASSTLYDNLDALKQHDIVVFDCEGGQNDKTPTQRGNVVKYTAAGGRVFASHYSYVWLFDTAPFSGTASWNVDQPFPDEPFYGILDTSFPKGQAFAAWLGFVNALSSPGKIQIHTPRHDAQSVVAPSQRWISSTAPNPDSLQHYTFNTPVGVPDDQQCGRVVFSDFHVTGSNGSSGGKTFPTECDGGPLSPQEKVLEFMLFDLASCIQKDNVPPKPPPVR